MTASQVPEHRVPRRSERITAEEAARYWHCAESQGSIEPEDSAWIAYDLDRLDARFERIRAAFGPGVLHAVAVKANPLFGILQLLAHKGAGFEVASWPEVELARRTGVRAERICFDSPAKTREELNRALELGLHLNADNLEELERIEALLSNTEVVRSRIGLRINPQIGAGRIPTTGVSAHDAKFGVPIAQQEEILRAFERYPWLGGLHLHTGSQAYTTDEMVHSVKVVLALANELRQVHGPDRIECFDLGGGLPVSYDRTTDEPRVEDYVESLRANCASLFDSDWRLVTEFGRWLYAPTAVAFSRVEYTRSDAQGATAVVHLGADMFLRECYQPEFWSHELSALSADGCLKEGDERVYRLAGPLCFSGDVVAPAARLPRLEAGDWLCFHDVGAYTLSMWSRYNSRAMPRVLGFEESEGQLQAQRLLARESTASVLRTWGCR